MLTLLVAGGVIAYRSVGQRVAPVSGGATAARAIDHPSVRFHVFVKSDPTGADVFIEGADMPIGTTPVTLPIDLTGRNFVNLILRHKGYEDYEQHVINEMPLSIKMVSKESPPDSPTTLLQDDPKRGTSPSQNVQRVDEGSTKRSPPRHPSASSVASYATTYLTITSTPSGAEVVIDGNSVGKTPFATNEVEWGVPHSVTLMKHGFESYERMISGSDWVVRNGAPTWKANAKLRPLPSDPLPPAAPAAVSPEVSPKSVKKVRPSEHERRLDDLKRMMAPDPLLAPEP